MSYAGKPLFLRLVCSRLLSCNNLGDSCWDHCAGCSVSCWRLLYWHQSKVTITIHPQVFSLVECSPNINVIERLLGSRNPNESYTSGVQPFATVATPKVLPYNKLHNISNEEVVP